MSSQFDEFLNSSDFSNHSRRAFLADLRKFSSWFEERNKESFALSRVTTRDVVDFRSHLQNVEKKAVSTINRNLVTVRRFFQWGVDHGLIVLNPVKGVKEIRKQIPAPKGLEPNQVRRLLREIELRDDVRSGAIFSVLLYCGCRVGDLCGIELSDLTISERSGSVVFRHGKGNKYRTVPLPLAARKAVSAYLAIRPESSSTRLFLGERGPLTDRAIRVLCEKYGRFCCFEIHPHLLRHTFSHKFLADNQNDLVSLSQILGHESLNTTARYTKRTDEELGNAAENVNY